MRDMANIQGRLCAPALVVLSWLLTSCASVPCPDTETCCVQAHPGNPEACGLSAAEAAAILTGAAGAELATSAMSEDDSDEGWRQHCIDNYVRCKSQKKPRWVGNCYECFRNCEGQRQWPFAACHPQRS